MPSARTLVTATESTSTGGICQASGDEPARGERERQRRSERYRAERDGGDEFASAHASCAQDEAEIGDERRSHSSITSSAFAIRRGSWLATSTTAPRVPRLEGRDDVGDELGERWAVGSSRR